LLCHVGLGWTLLILFMDHGSCVVWVGVKTMNLKVWNAKSFFPNVCYTCLYSFSFVYVMYNIVFKVDWKLYMVKKALKWCDMTHFTCILELVIKHKPNAIDYVVIALGFFKGNSPHSCKAITILFFCCLNMFLLYVHCKLIMWHWTNILFLCLCMCGFKILLKVFWVTSFIVELVWCFCEMLLSWHLLFCCFCNMPLGEFLY
jgi:hypothetical protein